MINEVILEVRALRNFYKKFTKTRFLALFPAFLDQFYTQD